jgi:hypothetical protein
MFTRALPIVIALATAACVKQGQVRAPSFDLYHACSDAQLRSACMPAPDEQPIQVDTNLAGPKPATSTLAG